MKHTSASQHGGCKQNIKHDHGTTPPKANIGVVLINQYYQQLICCVKKIGKNDTHFKKSKEHKRIGLLMNENSNFQLSCHKLESIEITCARQVWQFITQPIQH